jgi:hypothetical protein
LALAVLVDLVNRQPLQAALILYFPQLHLQAAVVVVDLV